MKRLFLAASAVACLLTSPTEAQPVMFPAGYAPTTALCFGASGSICVNVTSLNPLPVFDATVAQDSTLQNILTALTTTAPYLPPQSATSDTTLGLAPSATSTASACRVLKNTAGNLYSTSGYISAAGFIMVFDAASAPADGTVTPVTVAYAAAAGSWFIDYGTIPAAMSNGITVCESSTGPFTKTAFATSSFIAGRYK